MYLIPLWTTLCASILTGLLGRSIGRAGAQVLCLSGMLCSCIASYFIFYEVCVCQSTCYIRIWLSVDLLDISGVLTYDPLASIMLAVITTVSLCAQVYSIGYMKSDPHSVRFFAWLSLFSFFMILLVLSENVLQSFIGWGDVLFQEACNSSGSKCVIPDDAVKVTNTYNILLSLLALGNLLLVLLIMVVIIELLMFYLCTHVVPVTLVFATRIHNVHRSTWANVMWQAKRRFWEVLNMLHSYSLPVSRWWTPTRRAVLISVKDTTGAVLYILFLLLAFWYVPICLTIMIRLGTWRGGSFGLIESLIDLWDYCCIICADPVPAAPTSNMHTHTTTGTTVADKNITYTKPNEWSTLDRCCYALGIAGAAAIAFGGATIVIVAVAAAYNSW